MKTFKTVFRECFNTQNSPFVSLTGNHSHQDFFLSFMHRKSENSSISDMLFSAINSNLTIFKCKHSCILSEVIYGYIKAPILIEVPLKAAFRTPIRRRIPTLFRHQKCLMGLPLNTPMCVHLHLFQCDWNRAVSLGMMCSKVICY